MGGVFISYRREDSQGEALHLFDDLKEHFGIDRIFMDVTGIDPGKDFRKVIENAVTTCDVLIVMIGKEWIDAVDEEGKRRLDDPKDFVRIETAAALHRDVPVIPVLVQGTGMPRSEQLPAEIEALAWRNAFELRHNRWSIDVAELVTALRKVVPVSSTISSKVNKPLPWWQTVAGILTAVGTAIAALTGLVVALHPAEWFGGSDKKDTPHQVETTPSSEWLTAAQFQQAFDKQVQEGFYPDKVEGRCESDSEQFHVEWKGIPLGAGFASHHGITKEVYESKNQEYVSNGYSLEALNKFKDCSGRNRYQATWFKKE